MNLIKQEKLIKIMLKNTIKIEIIVKITIKKRNTQKNIIRMEPKIINIIKKENIIESKIKILKKPKKKICKRIQTKLIFKKINQKMTTEKDIEIIIANIIRITKKIEIIIIKKINGKMIEINTVRIKI